MLQTPPNGFTYPVTQVNLPTPRKEEITAHQNCMYLVKTNKLVNLILLSWQTSAHYGRPAVLFSNRSKLAQDNSVKILPKVKGYSG